MLEIVDFKKEQFDPKLFIVRERFKFWSDMQRKPGETLQELAARIRQEVATCDLPSIKGPQGEALRQRVICSVNNEAVLKALFKIKDTELTFARAVEVAIETEDAARVAKETVYEPKARPVNKVHQNKMKGPQQNHQQSHSKDQQKYYVCGKAHKATDCPPKEAECHFCDKKGHLKAVCQKKQRQEQGRYSHNPVKRITKAELVKAILGEVSQDTPRLGVRVTIQDHQFTMGLDTATTGNFVSLPVKKQLGKPKLDDVRHHYESASKHNLPVLGTLMAQTKHPVTGKQSSITYIVSKIPDLLNRPSTVDPTVLDQIPQKPVITSLDLPPTIDEVSKAIRQTSSLGMDGIPAEIFKSAGPVALEALHSLLISIWEEEDVPKEFRNATFVSLFKNRGSKTDCVNYRGISLLFVSGKILARVILNRLITNISEENLPETPCGFRPNRSTTDMIFSVRQVQEKCIEQNMDVVAVSIDLTKAFDTVNREALWG